MPTRAIPPRSKQAPHAIWHYIQPGYSRPVEGFSLADLIKNLIEFRIANNLDIGRPEEDVEDFIRLNWPGLATRTPDAPTVDGRKKPRTLLDEIRLTNKLWSKGETKFERKDEAERRALICEKCPRNVKIQRVTSCSPCVAQLNRDAVILSGNRKTGRKIAFCKGLRHDNRVAVWLPKEKLSQSMKRISAAPRQCWLWPLTTQTASPEQDLQQDANSQEQKN